MLYKVVSKVWPHKGRGNSVQGVWSRNKLVFLRKPWHSAALSLVNSLRLLYVQGDDIMHFTDSCRFLISSDFRFTALCTILLHCVQFYRIVYNLTALEPWRWGMGPETSHVPWATEPGWLAYLGPMYIKSPMDLLFIRPCTLWFWCGKIHHYLGPHNGFAHIKIITYRPVSTGL